VHTSDEKIGAAYAAIAVAAEADIRHHAEELSGMRGGGGSGRRRGASASFGGNVASTRSHVRSAARGLVAALEKLPGAGGAELLRHLPAVAHLLLSIVAAPPTSIAAAVAADAAEAAALRAAKAAADEAARLAEAALERAAALGAAVNEATVPPTPYHTPHPTKHSDRGVGGDDSPTDDSPDRRQPHRRLPNCVLDEEVRVEEPIVSGDARDARDAAVRRLAAQTIRLDPIHGVVVDVLRHQQPSPGPARCGPTRKGWPRTPAVGGVTIASGQEKGSEGTRGRRAT
jgi:hypothetical protein